MSDPFRDSRLPGALVVTMPEPADFEFWRDRARALVQCDVPPDRVAFIEPGGSGSLFGQDDGYPFSPSGEGKFVRANRQFVSWAREAICHADAGRFDLLYRLLWRLQGNPRLLDDRADPDVRKLEELARGVRRDIHKMRAFVRFREVENAAGEKHYVAWFEPQHHILRMNAGFFVRRFANMKWSILTPLGSLHWDGENLAEGPPAQPSDAPAGDPAEELWRKYYASIFNPARLKVGAMLKEMPRRYWKNMPEAALIPELVAGAQAREAAMVETGRGHDEERPRTLSGIENLTGSNVTDILYGDANNNVLNGAGGDDFLIGGGGNDTLDGGTGIDTAIFSIQPQAANVSWNVSAFVVTGPDGTDTVTNVEALDDAGGGSRILLVGGGGYATISDALADAANGDTIVIAPGTYNESLLIDKEVSIVGLGNPGDVVIQGNFRAANGNFAGLVSDFL